MKARIRKLADKKYVAEIGYAKWLWGDVWYACGLESVTLYEIASTGFRTCIGDYGQCLEELHNRGFATKDIVEVI